jgi:hypothetical protein
MIVANNLLFGRKYISSNWDLSNLMFISSTALSNGLAVGGAYWSNDGLRYFAATGSSSKILKYITAVPFDETSLVLDSELTLANNLQGIWFSPDGLKMITIEYGSGILRSYTLSTAWDILTTTFITSVSTVNTMTGLYFSPDGTKLFLSYRYQRVYRYNLSTPYDLSTLSLVGFITVSSGENYLTDVFFKPDGLRMFLLSFSSQELYQYNLSTAWDLNTAIYDKKAAGLFGANDVYITNNGEKLFISRQSIIETYTLTI